jgi:hypothetical protein
VKRIVSSGSLAVAIALLAVGCGGRGSSSTRSTGSAVGAQAVAAYARAINIQPADVPALSAEGREARLYQSERIVVPFRCGRIKFPFSHTTIHSASFVGYAPPRLGVRLPRMKVLSEVQVTASAARGVAAFRERRVQQCIGRYPLTAGGARGSLVRPRVRVTTLSLTPPPGGFAFSAVELGLYERARPSGEPSEREQMDKRFHIHTPRFATDYLGFADGRGEVTLLVFRTTDAAPLALERRLLTLLYARARAHTP